MREVTKSSTTTASAIKRWNKMLLKESENKTKQVQELESQIPKSGATADEQLHEAPRKLTNGRIKK